MNVEAVMTALLAAALLSAVPLILAAIGEGIGERAGLLNLGVEGVMLIGGFVAFWISMQTESHILGLLAGMGAGLLLGAVYGALAIVAKADQVLLGLGITLAGGGLTAFLFRETFGASQPLLTSSLGRPFAGSGDAVPVIGPALMDQRWFVYLAVIAVVLAEVLVRRTDLGLRIRAVGEAPFAVDATGHSVARTRAIAALIANGLAGLGGAALVIVELGFFQPGVTQGLGFIAIAIAMLGRLTPWRIALFALLFGALRGLETGLQLTGVPLRTEFLQMLPYIGVVIALIVVGRYVALPSALAKPYVRGLTRSDG